MDSTSSYPMLLFLSFIPWYNSFKGSEESTISMLSIIIQSTNYKLQFSFETNNIVDL